MCGLKYNNYVTNFQPPKFVGRVHETQLVGKKWVKNQIT